MKASITPPNNTCGKPIISMTTGTTLLKIDLKHYSEQRLNSLRGMRGERVALLETISKIVLDDIASMAHAYKQENPNTTELVIRTTRHYNTLYFYHAPRVYEPLFICRVQMKSEYKNNRMIVENINLTSQILTGYEPMQGAFDYMQSRYYQLVQYRYHVQTDCAEQIKRSIKTKNYADALQTYANALPEDRPAILEIIRRDTKNGKI